MLLREYLSQNNLSQAAFGSIIGTSQAAVGRYALGERTPLLGMAVKIEKITDGAVSYQDMLEATRLRKAQDEEAAGKQRLISGKSLNGSLRQKKAKVL
jgi:transcriptional regulator with XRE-family HTH domain